MRRIFTVVLGFVFATCLSNAYAAGFVTISGESGWTAGDIVINGRWTGQPTIAPNRGQYNGYLAVDSISPSYWVFNGSGFGTKAGSIRFSDGQIASAVTKWTDNQIKVSVSVPYTYTVNPSVSVTITTAAGSKGTTTIPVVATIQSRGYGQCTWYVANERIQQHLPIPSPGAYAITGSITAQYIPHQWDVVDFGIFHTAIIISPVTAKSVRSADGVSTTTSYSFTIGEMNVWPKAWSEAASTVPSTFVVITGKNTASVPTGILSHYKLSSTATAYYR